MNPTILDLENIDSQLAEDEQETNEIALER